MTWFLAMGGRSTIACTHQVRMLVAKEGSLGAEVVVVSFKVSA